MTTPDGSPDLPPEQHAVRRLLAEARHDEPVPPAVAARLDAVLEELSAGRQEARATAPVGELGARRRGWVGPALLAAAAVVVAGVGIGQVLEGGGSSDSGGAESTAGGGIAGGDDRAVEESAPPEASSESSDEDPSAGFESKQDGPTAAAAVPPVSSGSLRRDLRAALASAPALGLDSSTLSLPGAACGAADVSRVGAGRQVAVTLDDRPALALYRVPRGDRRRVDVYLCGTDVPAESVTLRAR